MWCMRRNMLKLFGWRFFREIPGKNNQRRKICLKLYKVAEFGRVPNAPRTCESSLLADWGTISLIIAQPILNSSAEVTIRTQQSLATIRITNAFSVSRIRRKHPEVRYLQRRNFISTLQSGVRLKHTPRPRTKKKQKA